jgi:glycosyltransferase involved in cell wall biosynthesis
MLRQHYTFAFHKAAEWSGKPDIIHLNVPWPLGNVARWLSKENQIPFIVTEHWTGYHPEDGRYKGRLLKAVTRKALAEAKLILPVSEDLQTAMQSHKLNGNYQVVYNVVDTDVFKPSADKPEKTRFLHVSALDDKQKNVSGLLRAFAAAKKKEPSIELIIVGHGNDESAIRRLSNELSLTTRGVEFHGFKADEDLAKEFQQASAMILNSRFENQPVVMLEAFACGVPVIAPQTGGIGEILNNERGILFKANDHEALVTAILQFHAQKNTYNAGKIREFAIKNFSQTVISEKLDQLYRRVLSA